MAAVSVVSLPDATRESDICSEPINRSATVVSEGLPGWRWVGGVGWWGGGWVLVVLVSGLLRCAVLCCTCGHHALCALRAGLQASPSKHTSYSVRMENAVPIVTQAPGAQPLQIQPGLLTQVGRQSGIARRWDLFMSCII